MLMIEPAVAIRFPAGAIDKYAQSFPNSGGTCILWSRCCRSSFGAFTRIDKHGMYRFRSSAEHSGLGSDPMRPNLKLQYHPFEAISESRFHGELDARLTPAETGRTVIEVNSQATIMFPSIDIGDDPDNIFWPGLHYLTDEHGNVYFKVNHDEDIMQSLTSENNFVQVVIGLDLSDLSRPSGIDLDVDEIELEDSSDLEDEDSEEEMAKDDIYDEDWDAVLETDEDEEDSDESIGDWAKLETMQSSHPLSFATKLAEAAAGVPVDGMDQAPTGLVIQGLLRPSFVDEHTKIHKQSGKVVDEKIEDTSVINGYEQEDEVVRSESSFYKLEMVNIQLVSSHGHQTNINIEDFRKARPDAIAHSAARIICRLKAGGDNTLQALKSLCWRSKGMQVQEATIIGIDALGFDLRVCSGTQVQTLRFAFGTRATSEYSAERQLNDLLFPRIQHKASSKGETISPKNMMT